MKSASTTIDIHSDLEQGIFSKALMDPSLDRPSNLLGREGKKAGKRFDVYRNNVIVSLMDALADAYPALQNTLGEENFSRVARIYISHFPPTSPLMAEFGKHMPEFLQEKIRLEGAEHAYDLARLERQWLISFHAADASPLTSAVFEGLDEDKIPKLTFEAQPAAKLIKVDPLALSAWQSSVKTSGRCEIAMPNAGSCKKSFTHGLMTRSQYSVQLFALSESTAAFVQTLLEGMTFEVAAENAVALEPEFNIGEALGFAISSGAFAQTQNNSIQYLHQTGEG